MRKYITENEWGLFFSAIEGSSTEIRDKPMFLMAYQHGLRVSELTGIRVNDLDLIAGTVYIKRLKNGFSSTHPLQDMTIFLLKKWLLHRQTIESVGKENSWLFTSVKGQRLSRQWVFKLSRKYGRLGGLTIDLHPHMLRHACGYALAEQGLDTRLIQDYLGHRNIHHTVHYTASNPGRFTRVWQQHSQRFWLQGKK